MTQSVIVVGMGGLGREVIDAVEAMEADGDDIAIAGVVDDRLSALNLDRLGQYGYPYLGTTDEILKREPAGFYICGIGDPYARRTIASRFEESGWTPAVVRHPKSSLGRGVSLAPGVVVCAGVRMTTNITVGQHVLLNLNVTVGHDTKIGAATVVNPGANISGDVSVGRDVLVGSGAVVLQGLEVGDRSTIGASACVTGSVERGSTVVGVPARTVNREIG